MKNRLLYRASQFGSKRGDSVFADGQFFTATKDTKTQPPGDDWLPSVLPADQLFETTGPSGSPGRDGRNGIDGRDDVGIDGQPGRDSRVQYMGTFRRRKNYEPGNIVSWDNQSWLCVAPNSSVPSESSSVWQLFSGPRGERGRDGITYTARGPRGRDGVSTGVETTETATCLSACSIGQPLRLISEGVVDLAQADTVDNAEICGVATTVASANGQVTYSTDGKCERDNWSTVTSEASIHLVVGKLYYLVRDTAGQLSVNPPSDTGVIAVVGRATSQTAISVEIQATIKL